MHFMYFSEIRNEGKAKHSCFLLHTHSSSFQKHPHSSFPPGSRKGKASLPLSSSFLFKNPNHHTNDQNTRKATRNSLKTLNKTIGKEKREGRSQRSHLGISENSAESSKSSRGSYRPSNSSSFFLLLLETPKTQRGRPHFKNERKE